MTTQWMFWVTSYGVREAKETFTLSESSMIYLILKDYEKNQEDNLRTMQGEMLQQLVSHQALRQFTTNS